MTQQQKATECSLRVVWVLGKHTKPFADAGIIKQGMTEVMDTMFESNQKGNIQLCILIYVKMEMTFYLSSYFCCCFE